MTTKTTAAITGVGAYLPDYILDNIELQHHGGHLRRMDHVTHRHQNRHILKGEGLGTSYMGERAVNDLLEKTGTDPMDIDVVICATVTPTCSSRRRPT